MLSAARLVRMVILLALLGSSSYGIQITASGEQGPVAIGDMYLYFGELHSHTSYSDGAGLPKDAYKAAREGGYSFFAVTDHAEQLTAQEWNDIQAQAKSATVDGTFIGLRGFEYTGRNGHLNVFDTDTYVGANDPRYDTLPEFYAWLAGQPTAIAQFNHPYIRLPDRNWVFNDFAYDPAAANKIALQEVGWNFSFTRFSQSLQAGWHVAPVYNTDTHDPDWGQSSSRIGILAPSLTKQHVLDALRARRTFATPDRHFVFVMKVNEAWMGSVVPLCAPDQELKFAITIKEPDTSRRLAGVMLYDNGVPVASQFSLGAPVDIVWTPTLKGTVGHYYYAIASYSLGDTKWSSYTSPVWASPCTTSRTLDANEYRLIYSSDSTFLRLENIREPKNSRDVAVTAIATVNGIDTVIRDTLDILDGKGSKDIKLGSLFAAIVVKEVKIEYAP